jgi:hypothetical protein
MSRLQKKASADVVLADPLRLSSFSALPLPQKRAFKLKAPGKVDHRGGIGLHGTWKEKPCD